MGCRAHAPVHVHTPPCTFPQEYLTDTDRWRPQRTSLPANLKGTWPPRPSGAPRWFDAASCSSRSTHGDRPCPC
eukprot:7156763-Prymnesium_polylepis.1